MLDKLQEKIKASRSHDGKRHQMLREVPCILISSDHVQNAHALLVRSLLTKMPYDPCLSLNQPAAEFNTWHMALSVSLHFSGQPAKRVNKAQSVSLLRHPSTKIKAAVGVHGGGLIQGDDSWFDFVEDGSRLQGQAPRWPELKSQPTKMGGLHRRK